MHSLVRKIPRPGRKTNAEHAISFYRHVLSLNEGEREDDDEESAKETKKRPRIQRVSKRKRGSDDDDEEEASKGETGSAISMDSEEFRNQHNDLCEVCNDVGELICCSTCNLVFHLQCIRPPTTRFPPDRWCCAYCVAAGVRGHSKEARTRRRAAAAAREMTRMKNELQGNETSASKDKDERKPPAKKEGRPKRAAKSEEKEATKDVEPKTKRAKTSDGESHADESDEAADGRTRRERRQPILYDPQAGAASTWQSDGVFEWKSLGYEQATPSDSETGDETASKETNEEETDDDKGSDEPVWCSFCNDDPSIAVCCFCACRKCFGKHDKVSLSLQNGRFLCCNY